MVSETVPGLVARVDVYEALDDTTQTDETEYKTRMIVIGEDFLRLSIGQFLFLLWKYFDTPYNNNIKSNVKGQEQYEEYSEMDEV
ncbi:hypothetical protein ACHAPG_004963 [Botrytis cinerea]